MSVTHVHVPVECSWLGPSGTACQAWITDRCRTRFWWQVWSAEGASGQGKLPQGMHQPVIFGISLHLLPSISFLFSIPPFLADGHLTVFPPSFFSSLFLSYLLFPSHVNSVSFVPKTVHVHLQSALGWDHQEKLSVHESQTDATRGFGGKYGVQKDRQDKVNFVEVLGVAISSLAFFFFAFSYTRGLSFSLPLDGTIRRSYPRMSPKQMLPKDLVGNLVSRKTAKTE